MNKYLPALASMSLEELFELHDELALVLRDRIVIEKETLERKLAALQPGTDTKQLRRRPNREVAPKFVDPNAPDRTWSGRGRQPRWVSERLAAGMTLDDLRVESQETSLLARAQSCED